MVEDLFFHELLLLALLWLCAILYWTYGREDAITPHLLYLLVTKGVTLTMPDVRDGRKRQENGSTIANLDLFYALQAQLRSCRSFPPVGPKTTFFRIRDEFYDDVVHGFQSFARKVIHLVSPV